jgi:hypothetical protein
MRGVAMRDLRLTYVCNGELDEWLFRYQLLRSLPLMLGVRRHMSDPHTIITPVLAKAISGLRDRNVPVHTFSLYYDHESPAISVCVDTEENSLRSVVGQNKYSAKYFSRAVANGDLRDGTLERKYWQKSCLGRFHSC